MFLHFLGFCRSLVAIIPRINGCSVSVPMILHKDEIKDIVVIKSLFDKVFTKLFIKSYMRSNCAVL